MLFGMITLRLWKGQLRGGVGGAVERFILPGIWYYSNNNHVMTPAQ